MILTCPQCATRYQVEDARFPAGGRKVRCAKCGHQWFQAAPGAEPPPERAQTPSPASSAPPSPLAVAAPPRSAPEAPRSTTHIPPPPIPPRVHPAPERTRAPGERTAVAAGWIALAAILLLIVWGGVRYREPIASVWPQTTSLYAAIGMPVNPQGLAFTGVSYRRDAEAGQLVLTVKGNVVNVSAREIAVPRIEVVLTDNNQHRLDRWLFSAGVERLKPGQKAAFATRRTNPPEEARHLEMGFAEAGG